MRMPLERKTPVLVLTNSELVLHHGGVGIIRSLGRLGAPVYCVVKDRLTPAAVSRYLTGAFVWRTGGLDAQGFVEAMNTMALQLCCPVIVIPTDDVSAILLAENAAVLKDRFIFPDVSPELPRRLANKRQLYALCRAAGVPCPNTVFPASLAEALRSMETMTFPVVVKAAEPWLLAAGELSTRIIRGPAELVSIYERSKADQRTDLMLQEYIGPDCGEDWFYHGYRNGRVGSCLGFTGQKLRSYPLSAGPTTLGKATPNVLLQGQAEELLNALSYCGIADLDYRFDKRDQKYKLLDFNPRVGAQFRVFADETGSDLARTLYLDMVEKGSSRAAVRTGKIFVTEFHDLAASLGHLLTGELSLKQWWLSVKSADELAWFSRDDPFPFLVASLRLLLRISSKLLKLRLEGQCKPNVPRYFPGRHRWEVSSR